MNKKQWINYYELAKETIKQFSEENAIAHSASIAFYTIFSLPGILIIVMRIAGTVFGEDLVKGKLSGRVSNLVGDQAAKEVVRILENAQVTQASSFMTIVGVMILIFSATTVFTIIQQALNHMWRVKSKPKRGWLKLIRDRVLSFAMVVTLGFLMLVSLLLDLFIVIFKDFINSLLSGNLPFIVPIASGILSFVIMVFVFGLIFKVLPDAIIKWKDVGVGAVVTTILFTLGKYLIGFYIGSSDFGSTYGAAGSLVLILFWVNYSAMIMLFGAEFTQVYMQYCGRRIHPTGNAVKVSLREEEIED